MEIILEVTEGIQVPPKIFNMTTKSFQNVHQCPECKYTISDNDLGNPYEPCPNCGGRFTGFSQFVAKWDKKQKAWCKRK